MKAKATHSGECQVCGSRQLLPAGVLSLHGYTKRWGFFSGICKGARHLPLEQSKDLIDGAIASVQAQRTLEQETAAALRQPVPAGTATAWVQLYRAATWRLRQGGYVWKQVELTRTEQTKDYGTPEKPYSLTSVDYCFTNPVTEKADRLQTTYLPEHGRCSLEVAIQHLNTQKADGLHAGLIKQLTLYIKWQQARIANWAPKPLTERKEQ